MRCAEEALARFRYGVRSRSPSVLLSRRPTAERVGRSWTAGIPSLVDSGLVISFLACARH